VHLGSQRVDDVGSHVRLVRFVLTVVLSVMTDQSQVILNR
jgi:hypothetical protein